MIYKTVQSFYPCQLHVHRAVAAPGIVIGGQRGGGARCPSDGEI
jgi:hypothetical protein